VVFMLFMNHASLIKVYPFPEKSWMILFLFHSLNLFFAFFILLVYLICR
jgi:hypothetical protein